MARMLRETIESAGYKAVIAQDGDEGIARIRKEKINPSSVTAPRQRRPSGACCCREEDPAMPVIATYGSVDTGVRAIKEGAFDFITKPFDTDHLSISKRPSKTRVTTENIPEGRI